MYDIDDVFRVEYGRHSQFQYIKRSHIISGKYILSLLQYDKFLAF